MRVSVGEKAKINVSLSSLFIHFEGPEGRFLGFPQGGPPEPPPKELRGGGEPGGPSPKFVGPGGPSPKFVGPGGPPVEPPPPKKGLDRMGG